MGSLLFNHHEFTIDNNFNICYIFIVLGFTSLIIYQFLIRRPSEEKLRKKSLIEGFKMYMGAAENEQLKFHNPPTMTPEAFEKFLPFAMVLGVDEIWGQKFDDLLTRMSTEYQNNWYVGSSMNHFAMTSMLNSGLTNSIQTTQQNHLIPEVPAQDRVVAVSPAVAAVAVAAVVGKIIFT